MQEVAQDQTFFDLDGTRLSRRGKVWLDTLNGFFYDYEASLPQEFEFGRISGAHVGGLSVARIESDPMKVWRTSTQIERDAIDAYFVLLPSDNIIGLGQRSREAAVNGQSFALVSASSSYSFSQDSRTSYDNLIVPGSILREATSDLEERVALRRGEQPVDRFFMDTARSFCANVLGLDENTRLRAGRHVVDLLIAALDGADYASSIRPVRRSHLARLKKLIREEHGDPNFDLDAAAAKLRLSRRYVQAILADVDLCFSGTLRKVRLDKAKELLCERSGHGSTIGEIAYATGFQDVAHFSRAYRNHHGFCPRDTPEPRAYGLFTDGGSLERIGNSPSE